jgi:RNA polymerase sigma factor (sigma-70 family)
MATNDLSQVLQQLCDATLSDGQLLERYLHNREAAAFAALVRRHGPMVWGVCRRALGNHHDAEDAFQATFLVLVRKAAAVVPREMVGNWLYGVAYQTARKARALADRRRAREKQVIAMPEPEAAEQDLWSDLRPLLDQELSRLPDRYRLPVVLCDLEGKTYKEAARQLGRPEGTLAAQLSRARRMLARRLTRHGVALSAGSLGLLLARNAAPASAPATVIASTIEAASLLAKGQAVMGGVISDRVILLMKGVLNTMLLRKLTIITGTLLIAAVVGALVLRPTDPVLAAPGEDAKTTPTSAATRIIVPAVLTDDGKRQWLLIAVDPDTGEWQKLCSTTASHPRVSPDGETVMFLVQDDLCNLATRGGGDSPGKLFEFSGYGGPSWSPDGKHLYYTTLQGQLNNTLWQHQSWRRDADGGNPTKLTLPVSEAILDVSRDGKYCLTRTRLIVGLNGSDLRVMKLDGTEARLLSEPKGFNEPGRFAPDGKRVAWCRNDKEGSSVWVTSTDGTGRKKVLADAGVHVEGCCWSPDGRRLAVVLADLIPIDGRQVVPYGREAGHWRLEIMDFDRQNRSQVPLKGKIVTLRDPDWYTVPK